VTLEVTAGTVRRIRVQKANETPTPSCSCRLGSSWVFFGSWVGDSVLLHVEPNGAKVTQWQPTPPPPILPHPARDIGCIHSQGNFCVQHPKSKQFSHCTGL